jgi:hypothetical protein
MAKSQKKICSRCGEEKPKSEFHKDSWRPDGLNSQCKQCRKHCYQKGPHAGLSTWDQVADAVRAMAESQSLVDEENVLRNHRISLINEYTDEIIEPHESRIYLYKTMIKEFLNANDCKAMESYKKFRFGTVKLIRGRLDVVLYKKLAKKMKGKP